MKKKICIILLVTIVVFSCKKTGVESSSLEQYVPGSVPMGFQTPIVLDETKAISKNIFDEGDEFGVYAYYVPAGGSWSPTSLTLINNQKVHYDGTTWSYDPPKYWPSNTNDNLHFFAYYPYDANFSFSGSKMTYSLDSKDILVATATPTEQSTVELEFNHALTAIEVRMMSLEGEDISVSKLEFKNIHNGANLHYDGNTVTWETLDETSQTFSRSFDCNTTIPAKGGLVTIKPTEGGDMMFMIPQKLFYGDEYDPDKVPYLQVTATRSGLEVIKKYNLAKKQVGESYLKGNKYVYDLSLFYYGDKLPVDILPKDPADIIGDKWIIRRPDGDLTSEVDRTYCFSMKDLLWTLDKNNCDKEIDIEIIGYTEIPKGAFNGTQLLDGAGDPSLNTLVNVSGNDIKVIHERAFKNCRGLKTVSFPAVETLSKGAIRDCPLLKTVEFNKLITVGEACFHSDVALESVTMPEVNIVGNDAFNSCTMLPSINLPKVTKIGANSFQGCKKLATVNMPNVETLKSNAFNGCESLTSISLPEVTLMEANVFTDCLNLKEISLPKVLKLGPTNFKNSTNLVSITLGTNSTEESPLTIGRMTFAEFDTTKVDLTIGGSLNGCKVVGGNKLKFFGDKGHSSVDYEFKSITQVQ